MQLFGDNGIISNAQNATIKQSEAELTEWLQEKYIEEQASIISSGDETSLTPLQFMLKSNSTYFYNPILDSTVTTGYDYIYYNEPGTSDFYALYFIKKSGLPDEIKNKLKGGDAGGESGENYAMYSSFTDCYLVNSDLKVCYLNGSLNSSELTKDTEGGLKVAFTKESSWSHVINPDDNTDITQQDLLSVVKLNISGNDGINDLKNIYSLSNLKELELTNYQGSLEGLSNARKLTKLYINNSDGTTDIDYSGIEGANGLKELYFYMPTDSEVEKMCNIMGDNSYSITKMGLFGGNKINISNIDIWYVYGGDVGVKKSLFSSLKTFEKLKCASRHYTLRY